MKDITEIKAAIRRVEHVLLPLDGLTPGRDWAEWNRRVAVIWTRVAKWPGVSLRYTAGACQFAMCGISTSSAAGLSTAAKAWLDKARAIVAEAEETA